VIRTWTKKAQRALRLYSSPITHHASLDEANPVIHRRVDVGVGVFFDLDLEHGDDAADRANGIIA
jgi:hypothetical protein